MSRLRPAVSTICPLICLLLLAGCAGDDAGSAPSQSPSTETRDRTTAPTGGGDSSPSGGDGGADDTPDTDSPGEEGGGDGPTACGVGRIEGRVCAPNSQTWIGGAEVALSGADCDGLPFEQLTVSDSEGFFRFEEVPSGTHRIDVRMGSFEADYTVNVNPGETSDFARGQEKLCLSDDSLEIAVVDGFYDHIHRILDALDVGYDLYSDEGDVSPAERFLLDPAAMSQYDIILINCGEQYLFFGWLADDPAREHQRIADNLRAFVQAGGSLYVSDWAYFLVERAFPNLLRFSPEDDLDYETSFRGAMGELTAEIVDSALQFAMGQDTVSIAFPAQGWVVAEAESSSVRTLVEGRVRLLGGGLLERAPLLLSFAPGEGSGTVFFTSFHNESQLPQEIERILHHVIFSL